MERIGTTAVTNQTNNNYAPTNASQIEILNVTGERMPGGSIHQFTKIDDEHNTTDSV